MHFLSFSFPGVNSESSQPLEGPACGLGLAAEGSLRKAAEICVIARGVCVEGRGY